MADSPIDGESIERLRRVGGDKLVRGMVSLFLENAPRRMEAAERALREGDPDGIRRAAHSMKSTAANLGALTLQDAAQTLELAAEASPAEVTPEIENRVAAMRAACDAAVARLKRMHTEHS